ncbi:MAG: hypothetical protein MUF42_16110 [Cytophagaceae bacterium]|jgi:hypothetical protein|nr:hypothetical protein [Cytophagaceae bacterium]
MKTYRKIILIGILAVCFQACRYKKLEVESIPGDKQTGNSSIPEGTVLAVTEKKQYIHVYDWDAADGDVLSFYLNGVLVHSNIEIFNSTTILEIDMDKGKNVVEIEANSIGSGGIPVASGNVSFCDSKDGKGCTSIGSLSLSLNQRISVTIIRN